MNQSHYINNYSITWNHMESTVIATRLAKVNHVSLACQYVIAVKTEIRWLLSCLLVSGAGWHTIVILNIFNCSAGL